jgi:hypothetical protein
VVSSYPYPLADVRLLSEQARLSFGKLRHRRLSLSFHFRRKGVHLPIPRRKLPYTEIRKVLR